MILLHFPHSPSASPRLAGYVFGPDIADQFLYANQLELIARSHQLAMEGYKYFFGQLLVTVWSAPNYCYRCGNVAAILTINVESVIDFSVFEPRPQHLRKVPEYNTRMVRGAVGISRAPRIADCYPCAQPDYFL